MSYLIVLPSIWPPYTDACMRGLAPDLADHLLVVDNTIDNLGVAGSWNVAARHVLDSNLDWLVVLSAATRFGPEGGADFIAALDRYRNSYWVVESSAPVGWHLLAWSRSVFEQVGLFDETFWPAYGEDADMSYRIHTAQREGIAGGWANERVDAWIAMQGHGCRLAKVQIDYDRAWTYYLKKWGGLSGHEMYDRPFNDPTLPLSYWPAP